MNNRNIDALDVLSIFSFFIGLINYDETIDQSIMQDVVSNAVKDIHKHLSIQDAKIDEILNILGGGVNER